MDFITGLPKSKGYEAVMVVVDRLSKYAHFIPLKHPYSAKTLADVFVKEVIRLHGVPISIVSDRDPIFVSNFWQEIFKLQGTHLKMSTAYHPQTDGKTEVVNRCLETFLRCFIAAQPKTWVLWISWVEYWYNTIYHSSTVRTPFEVVYGRAVPLLTRFLSGLCRSEVSVVGRELYLSVELSSVGGLGALFLSAVAIFLFIISNISQHLCLFSNYITSWC